MRLTDELFCPTDGVGEREREKGRDRERQLEPMRKRQPLWQTRNDLIKHGNEVVKMWCNVAYA